MNVDRVVHLVIMMKICIELKITEGSLNVELSKRIRIYVK